MMRLAIIIIIVIIKSSTINKTLIEIITVATMRIMFITPNIERFSCTVVRSLNNLVNICKKLEMIEIKKKLIIII